MPWEHAAIIMLFYYLCDSTSVSQDGVCVCVYASVCVHVRACMHVFMCVAQWI